VSIAGRLSAAIPDSVLARLLPEGRSFDPGELPEPLEFDLSADHRIVIGAENAAGQGAAWAESLRTHARGVSAQSFAVDRGSPFGHAVDRAIPAPVFAWSSRWQRRHRAHILNQATHVLIEGGRPFFAGGMRGDAVIDARRVGRAGRELAYVWHGSDIRDPDAHAARRAESPFATGAVDDRLRRALRDHVSRSRQLLRAVPAPSFVSTPDLLADLPDGHWLPLVVDTAAWQSQHPPLSRERRPVVVHAPSRAALKGSAVIDAVLERLAADGIVDYVRVAGVSRTELRERVLDADVVIDQLGIGSYGVLACEAMAAGRIVVGDPSEQVRAVVSEATGREVPITVTSSAGLEASIREICTRPDAAVRRAAEGPAFIADVHDGRRAAATIAAVCGLGPASTRMDA